MERKLSSLDERERVLRLTVFREPYVLGVTIGLVAASIGIGGLLSEEVWATGVMLAMFSSAYPVPPSVLAWKLPEGVPDEV